MAAKQDRAFLDHLEAYFAKRDGVDKALKILRYSSKVYLASPSLVQASDPAFAKKVKDFEASVGVSRKAFRLGKFIQDVNALRRISDLNSRDGFLELVSTVGEGFYYFLEQFVWLVKAGAIDRRHSKRLQKWSAWAEFTGYLGSVTLKAIQVSSLHGKEMELLNALKDSESEQDRGLVSRSLSSLRTKRFMKTLSLIQDLSDSLLALNDIKDGKLSLNDIKDGQGVLAKPRLLALAGLLSALISTHKNWTNC